MKTRRVAVACPNASGMPEVPNQLGAAGHTPSWRRSIPV